MPLWGTFDDSVLSIFSASDKTEAASNGRNGRSGFVSMDWGMFSPDQVASARRQQTLGLGSAVRHYNDRAVPGLGGLWYGMPVAWSLLGIFIAEELKKRPLPSANAVEALSMFGALEAGGNHIDRGLGRRKLASRNDCSFGALSARGAYVTQPRRMGTVQPLEQLGFVQPSPQRFNLYRLSSLGEEFLKSFGAEKVALLSWAEGSRPPKVKTLWPSAQLPRAAAGLLDKQLRQFGSGNDAARRCALLNSSPDALSSVLPLLESRPQGRIDSAHWADLRSGIALVQLRAAAVGLLARVEQFVIASPKNSLEPDEVVKPLEVKAELALLCAAARTMLAEPDTSPDGVAHEFARLCSAAPVAVVLELARRDGAVLRVLANGRLGLGSAGGATKAINDEDVDGDGDAEAGTAGPLLIPELPRIANLYKLAADLGLNR